MCPSLLGQGGVKCLAPCVNGPVAVDVPFHSDGRESFPMCDVTLAPSSSHIQSMVSKARHLRQESLLFLSSSWASQDGETGFADFVQLVPIVLQGHLVLGAPPAHHLQGPTERELQLEFRSGTRSSWQLT